jgi:hypothetical protein
MTLYFEISMISSTLAPEVIKGRRDEEVRESWLYGIES